MKQESANGADPRPWLTKQEALSMLGKSERSLDRLVAAGKVQKQTRQRDGRTPEPLYNRADLERATAIPAFEMPATGNGGQPLAPRDAQPLTQRADPGMLALIASATRLLAASPRDPGVSAPLWCGIAEASQLTGLSERLLRRLIRTSQLPALRDGTAWKIRRFDLHSIAAPKMPAKRSAKRATPATMARTQKAGGGA